MSSYAQSCRASSTDISSMFSAYIAIQPVPSDCSSSPATGSAAERSNGPMLSRPRKPPSNTLLPSLSLRLTHQVKFSSSLCMMRARKSMSVPPSIAKIRSAAHACTGGLTSPNAHSYAGIWPAGCRYQSRSSSSSCSFAKRRIDPRDRDAVEREIPGREPRIFPRIGHRDHVRRVHVPPAGVAAVQAGRRRRRSGRIAGQPAVDVEVVILLAPHQPGHRGPRDGGLVVGRAGRHQIGEERVRLARSGGDHLGEAVGQIERVGRRVRQPDPDHRGFTGRHVEHVVQGRLACPYPLG